MKPLILIFCSLLLFSCQSSDYNDQPNRISRVDVLSKNKNQITISHSTRGKKIAFRFADEHCETFGKIASWKGATQQFGPDIISTWRCED